VATVSDTTDETRWLDGDERAAWLGVFELILKLPAAIEAQLQRDSDLSLYEYMVLVALSERPDRTMRHSALARFTNGSLSRLSHVSKRLAQQGFLVREAAPVEGRGRSTKATLTDAGFAKVVAAAPGHVANVRNLIIDPLSRSELADVVSLTDRILDQVDPRGRFTKGDNPLTEK